MAMKEKDCISVRVGLPFLALVLLFPQQGPLGTSSMTAQLTPLWWEISIVLQTEGEYVLEGEESDCRGNYSFLIHWKGCLEKDDDDYLLYHMDSRLADWKAQETVSSPRNATTLTTHDIKKKPSLSLRYILRRETDLFVNFLVKGIVVPESGGEESFFLFFPSSEENGQRRAQVDYNACIVEGSNGVSLKEAEIYAEPVTKEYSWTWKHQQRESRQGVTVSASQSHRTSVSLCIIPHYAGPQ
jgi:hypothetical protein